LNCLVLGQDIHTVFPIEIPKTKSVGALKDAIKDKNPVDFNDVDAKALVLYNVSFPIDERLQHELQKLPLDQPLIGGHPLSKVFSTLQEENLHIIVTPPAHTSIVDRLITLNCLVYGQNIHTIFPIKISNTESIGALKDVIKEKNPVDFADVDAKVLALYKVSFPVDERLEFTVHHFQLDDSVQPLIGATKVSRIFSNHSDDEKLHIIIDVP
ncbi:hypothetical protein BU15DRAFT_17722, partial [Melanogaster broomeanus]